MRGEIECADIAATFESINLEAVITPEMALETDIGGEVQIDVGEKISYVKVGVAEIEAAVVEGTTALNLTAESKTIAFDYHVSQKVSLFDANAAEKTESYNLNASAKIAAYDDNASAKQALIDAAVNTAQSWATKTGTTVDGTEYSAKYYAALAAEIVAGINQNDMVHKSGAEIITGAKTFTSSIIEKIDATMGTAPTSSMHPKPFIVNDANGNLFSCIQTSYLQDKTVRAELLAYNGANASDTTPASLGVINNNGTKYAFAPAPTEDTASSTQIDTVGARNTKLANYVTLSDNQNITGRKTFVGGYQNVKLKMNSAEENAYTDLTFLKNDDTRAAYVRVSNSGEFGIVADKVSVPANSVAGSALSTVAISKAQNGYVQLGNGVIINWGKATVQTSSQSTTVTFSKSFSNNNAAHVAIQGGGATLPKVASLTSTSFVVSRDQTDTSAQAANYTWIAVGY